jgi:hypothetical protein
MDIETVRRATTRRKMVTAQRAADDRLKSAREIRAARERFAHSSQRNLGSEHRQTMLRSAVDYEKRASQLDNKADTRQSRCEGSFGALPFVAHRREKHNALNERRPWPS